MNDVTVSLYYNIKCLHLFRDYTVFSNAFLQDFRPSEVYTCEFLLDNTQMGFLVADGDKNLVLFMYQPESRESFGGTVVSSNIFLLHFCALNFYPEINQIF